MESNLTSVTTVTNNVTNYNVCNDTNDALIDRLIYNEASWWLDYVFELIICFLGIMGNTLAIILLQSERLGIIHILRITFRSKHLQKGP